MVVGLQQQQLSVPVKAKYTHIEKGRIERGLLFLTGRRMVSI
jgi:hypothetical protein